METATVDISPQVRDFGHSSVDQAEKAFAAFIDAAKNSVAMVPSPVGELSRHVLLLTEQNIKASFEHARRLLQARDLQEIMQLQSEFVKSQFAVATEQMKQFGSDAAVKTSTTPV